MQGHLDPIAVTRTSLCRHALPAGSWSPWRDRLSDRFGRLHFIPGVFDGMVTKYAVSCLPVGNRTSGKEPFLLVDLSDVTNHSTMAWCYRVRWYV